MDPKKFNSLNRLFSELSARDSDLSREPRFSSVISELAFTSPSSIFGGKVIHTSVANANAAIRMSTGFLNSPSADCNARSIHSSSSPEFSSSLWERRFSARGLNSYSIA